MMVLYEILMGDSKLSDGVSVSDRLNEADAYVVD